MTPSGQAVLPGSTAERDVPAPVGSPVDAGARPSRAVRLQPRLALPVVGAALWAVGLTRLHPQGVGDLGVLGSGLPSALIAAGLVGLLAGFLLELRREARTWVLALELVGVIVAVHATVPIVFGGPEYSWVYKHVGIASAFQRYGRVTDPSNIYDEWPALFTAVASLSSLAHTTPLAFARWAPLGFELGDALLLLAVFRLLVGDRRIVWLAILLYEGLIAWVGQDYLSPQAFTYLLWLGMAFVVLRWLRRAGPSGAPGRLDRLRAPLLNGLAPVTEASRAMRAVALGLVVAIFVAIVAAHQLTPYMALAAVGALTLLDVIRPRWLLLVMVGMAGGYLALHYGLIAQQFGGLFSGGNPLANAGGARGTPNASVGAVMSSRAVHALMAVMWLGAVAVVVARRRRLGEVALPAALAFSPFVVVLAQSYGGEAIYRVYLFSAPWCALLIAGAVLRLRVRRRWPVAAIAAVFMVLAGVQGLYGPAIANAFTAPELNASLWLYRTLPHGSLIVLPVDNFPGQESADYGAYDVQLAPADPQFGAAWMNEGNLAQVRGWIAGLGHRTAYVVVSRSMDGWARYYGAPVGYSTLARDLPTSLHGSVVYHNRDATVYRVQIKGASR